MSARAALRHAAFACVLTVAAATTVRAGEELTITPIARDGQVWVSFELTDGFTDDVSDAIQSGLPTTFTYEVELRRGSTGWFDRTIASVTLHATVRFDNLTRRYDMSRSVDGREVALESDDRDVMRRFVTAFDRVRLTTTSALEENGEYYVRVRARTRPRNSWFLWPWDRGSALGHAKFTLIE